MVIPCICVQPPTTSSHIAPCKNGQNTPFSTRALELYHIICEIAITFYKKVCEICKNFFCIFFATIYSVLLGFMTQFFIFSHIQNPYIYNRYSKNGVKSAKFEVFCLINRVEHPYIVCLLILVCQATGKTMICKTKGEGLPRLNFYGFIILQQSCKRMTTVLKQISKLI